MSDMVGDRLKQLREEAAVSVAELASRSGVSEPYIRQIENGTRGNPSGNVLKRLAVALHCAVADLIGEERGQFGEEQLDEVPESLSRFARRRGKELGMRQADLDALRRVRFRGKQPATEEDWELLFLFLKRLLK